MRYLSEHDDCPITSPHEHSDVIEEHLAAYGDAHDEDCPICGTNNYVLDEWEITLVIRSVSEAIRPEKWDFNTLLDLQTGIGEQAWVESARLVRTGTEQELEAPIDTTI